MKSPENDLDFRKLYIWFLEYLRFNAQTMLFDLRNTSVWLVKQYSFTSPNNIVSSVKVKSSEKEMQKVQVPFAGRWVVSTNRKVSLCTVQPASGVRRKGLRPNRLSGRTSSKANGWQGVFCESLQNATKSTKLYLDARKGTVEAFVWQNVNGSLPLCTGSASASAKRNTGRSRCHKMKLRGTKIWLFVKFLPPNDTRFQYYHYFCGYNNKPRFHSEAEPIKRI